MSKPGSELRRARIACAFLLVGSLCLASPARAQTPGPVLEVAGRDTLSSMVALGTRFMIRSEILHETREVIVAVPPGNEKGREKFPVLYVLDGGQNLLTTVSASRALAGAGRMPPVIVVVIVNESKELQLCGIERTPAGEGL
jgi:enterochelin esterase-like enzyme